MMLRLEVVTKKIKFRVCMPMVGSQYNSKLYIKKWCYVIYKGASMDPSWMHAKRNSEKKREKKEGEKWCPTTLFKYCCFPKMSDVRISTWRWLPCNRPSSPSTNSGAQYSKVPSHQHFSANALLLGLCWPSQHVKVSGWEGSAWKPHGGGRSVVPSLYFWVSSS